MNRKGFTLVELIAMLVVIGILMLIAVPNISGILKKNRENISVEDINKMVGNTKTKIETGKAKYPKVNGQCAVLSLQFIDNNNDIKSGVNGGLYDKTESFILVKKEQINATTASNQFKYYVRLVEKDGDKTYIIPLIDYDEYAKEPDEHVPQFVNFTDEMKLNLASATKEEVKDKVNDMISNLCTSVSDMYK